MTELNKKIIHFSLYPPNGEEDWSYAYQTALVRTLSDALLDGSLFNELANCADFKTACEILSTTEYAINEDASEADIAQMLCDKRNETKELAYKLLENEKVIEFLKAHSDFANMRLAIRRLVLEKPLGEPKDYCSQGNIPTDQFELVFEQEDYTNLPVYLQQAVEAGVLGYYKNKNVRDIDIAVDKSEAQFQLQNAVESGSVFMVELAKMQIDLSNIRTMMRLKATEDDSKDVFMDYGYLEPARLAMAADAGFDGLAQMFTSTPYHSVIETGAAYFMSNNSFLKLEAACESHFLGFLRTTDVITAGLQPVVAYLLRKLQEIRMVRMLLACKKAQIENKNIHDRLAI